MDSSVLHRIFWGIVLVAVGGVFLLEQTGTIEVDIGELFRVYWPVMVIFFGLQGLLFQRGGAMLWNSIVVLVGVFFLGRNLEWFTWELGDVIRFIGPAALILFGLNMIVRGNRRKPACRKREEWNESDRWSSVTPPPPPYPGGVQGPPPAPPLSDNPGASFTDAGASANQGNQANPGPGHDGRESWRPEEDARRDRHQERRQHAKWNSGGYWGHQDAYGRHSLNRFIGDVRLGDEPWELQPMSISMFIGDTKLDLTTAHIPSGETRVYISSFIGDVKVFVPNESDVGIQVVSSSMIGDVKVLKRKEGGLFNSVTVQTPNFTESDKKVVFIVSSFIGDVRVTKVG